MRSWLAPLAAVALVVLLAAVAVAILRPPASPTVAERTRQIAAELRCPDCQALSVAESHTAAAEAIRAEIEQQLAAGRSVDQVRASFVARYGEWILLQPANPWIWALPAVGLLIGIGALLWWLRGHPRRIPFDTPPPAEAERQRIREELEALDG